MVFVRPGVARCTSVVRTFASKLKYRDKIVSWKEGNVLFNDALNTFYLRLYGVGQSEDQSDS